jgi:hypothetical protein
MRWFDLHVLHAPWHISRRSAVNEPWVCIGHSHAAALMRAAESGAFALDTINFWDTGEPWVERAGATRLRTDLTKRLEKGRLVISTIGGSAHSVRRESGADPRGGRTSETD